MGNLGKSKFFGKGLAIAFLTVWAIISLFPMFWMFYTAFLKEEAIKTADIGFTLDSGDFTLANFSALFQHASMGRWFVNSVLICLIVTALHLIFDAMAGYAFARGDFPGRDLLFWLVIGTMMVPGQVIIIPTFILVTKMGLIDSALGVILPALAGPFGIFMMRQFMLSIPKDLEDAARIDGCSELGIFFRVILPLCTPAMSTLGIFVFVTHWNAFLWPLVVLYSSEKYTLPVGLATLQGQHIHNFGLLMAGAALAALPMVLVFLFFSRFFIKGMQSGAVKG